MDVSLYDLLEDILAVSLSFVVVVVVVVVAPLPPVFLAQIFTKKPFSIPLSKASSVPCCGVAVVF